MLKISIVTAVLNRAGTIAQAIDSLNQQSYPSDLVQHIIIDGLSTDGTREICELHRNSSSMLISESDEGIYYALNKGIELATGDIVGILHSDDFYADQNILNDVAKLFECGVDIVYGDLNYISKLDTRKIIRKWVSGKFDRRKLKYGWMAPHPTVFLRSSLIKKLGIFDTNYRISADYDALVRYFNYDNIKFAYIPRVMVNMRVGGESNRSLNKILQKMKEDYMVIKKNKVGGFISLACKNLSKFNQFI